MIYKIKYQIVIILLIVFGNCCQSDFKEPNEKTNNFSESELTAQFEELYKPSNKFDHLNHIRKKSKVSYVDDREIKPKYFVDYVVENLLEKKEHKKYITDRQLLRKLNNEICWDNYVLIRDTLLNGARIEVEIKAKEFNSYGRELGYEDKFNFLAEIDGKYPYGAVYSKVPNRELESLKISINGKRIKTLIDKYNNLYEPEFCNFGGYRRIIEGYEDGENIYIYIFGGNAAGSYFAKLVFDKTEGYVTSIISEYGALSMYGSFGEHFIGY